VWPIEDTMVLHEVMCSGFFIGNQPFRWYSILTESNNGWGAHGFELVLLIQKQLCATSPLGMTPHSVR
jgi:hypothetical protein